MFIDMIQLGLDGHQQQHVMQRSQSISYKANSFSKLQPSNTRRVSYNVGNNSRKIKNHSRRPSVLALEQMKVTKTRIMSLTGESDKELNGRHNSDLRSSITSVKEVDEEVDDEILEISQNSQNSQKRSGGRSSLPSLETYCEVEDKGKKISTTPPISPPLSEKNVSESDEEEEEILLL
jgi:hypothetical protein